MVRILLVFRYLQSGKTHQSQISGYILTFQLDLLEEAPDLVGPHYTSTWERLPVIERIKHAGATQRMG
mgnify:CR=1 FL=1